MRKKAAKKKSVKKATETSVELSPEEPLPDRLQQAVIDLLFRGASPAAACGQLGVPVETLLRTINDDPEFARRTGDVTSVLSGNVMAMLYRTAMDGNVSAQSSWLKLFPPATWQQTSPDPTTPLNFDETLEELSNDELVELAHALGVELPQEIAPGMAESAVAPQSRGVSSDCETGGG